MTKLKKCANCGSKGEFGVCDDESEDFGGEFVACTNAQCGMSTPIMFPSMDSVKEELAEIWNRRAPAPPADGERKGGWAA